jgi:hypothetical protein
MTPRRRLNPFKSLSEPLEVRCLPSGNVIAGVVQTSRTGFSLKLTGDDEANSVRITQVGPRRFKIEGLNNTKINGTSQATLDLPNQIKQGELVSLSAKLSGGNDNVTFGAGTLTFQSVSIDTGTGADGVYPNLLKVMGTTTLTLGSESDADADRLEVLGLSEFSGNLTVSMGGGNDYFKIDSDITVGSNFTTNLGSGDDYAEIDENAHIVGDTTYNMGDGQNELNIEEIHSARSLQVNGGKNYDDIYIEEGVETNQFIAKLGDGADHLRVRGIARSFDPQLSSKTYASKIDVDMGAGNDTTWLNTAFALSAVVKLGDGDNTLVMSTFYVQQSATITGGVNRDYVQIMNSTFYHTLTGSFGGGDDIFETLYGLPVKVSGYLTLTGGTGTNFLYAQGLVANSRRITGFTIR